ncbi:MAG: hypothetical protein ACXW1Z_21340 [Methylobacter sp.]
MKTNSTELLTYPIGWFAALFASHADYKSLSLAEGGILLEEGKSVRNKILYLSIGSNVTVDHGIFWDVLAIPLEDGQIIRFGGVTKNSRAGRKRH